MLRALMAAAAAASMLIAPAAAHADSGDEAFLETLQDFGVTCAAMGEEDNPKCDATWWIGMGHAVCRDLAVYNVFQVGDSMTEVSHGKMSNAQVYHLIGASVGVYCPQYQSEFKAPSTGAGKLTGQTVGRDRAASTFVGAAAYSERAEGDN